MNRSPSPFDYSDYRAYLRDALQTRIDSGLSYRSVSKRCGISSPNFLQSVIRRDRNLTLESGKKIAEGLGLKGPDKRYFLAMVGYDRASDAPTKTRYIEKLYQYASLGKNQPIRSKSIYETWVHAFLWELILVKKDGFTPKEITRQTQGLVSEKELEESIKTLVEKGFIVAEEKGKYRQTSVSFDPVDDIKTLEIQRNHLKFLEIARQKINDDPKDREFQGLTIAVRKAEFPSLKRKIREFIAELNNEYSYSQDPDLVAHFECCLFQLLDNSKETKIH
ncbi:MAG: TIGR02147 family protein [Oligoflexales bacterium]